MNMRAHLERRFAALELRASGRRLSGYAAVFNERATIIGDQTEEVVSGAFTRSLATNPDILALFDHDPAKVLARTRASTLTLTEDAKGLHFSLEAPNTAAGNDALELARRGDLGGASFGFVIAKENRTGNHRQILDVNLHEISIISSWPAYAGTSVEARARLAVPPRRAALLRSINLLELAKWH
jgi:uncharacterized protein